MAMIMEKPTWRETGTSAKILRVVLSTLKIRANDRSRIEAVDML